MTDKRITVADSLLQELQRQGADTIFGIISIHNIPIFDALERRGGFRVVSARHEGAAVNMADAYARVSGKLGVALTSTGTGAGNAAGALIEAQNGGAPLLPRHGSGRFALCRHGPRLHSRLQGTVRHAEGISKNAHRIRRAEQAPSVFRRAIAQAITAPAGPVSVEIPIDFQAALIEPAEVNNLTTAADPVTIDLNEAVERIAAAKRPIIWAGGGAMLSDSSNEVRQLMEMLDAAVITTQSGRGIVPETDSRCIGHFATYPALKEWVGTADLLISIGVRFRGNETSNWTLKTPAEHIGIDADPTAINRNFPQSIGLVGNAKTILGSLISLLEKKRLQPKPDFREEVSKLRSSLRQQLRDTLGPWEGVLDGIRETIPKDAILVRDVTVPATTWGARIIERLYPRTTVHASAGGIGQGLPMAIGAQIATPSKTVVLMAGDGGLLLNIGEMAVARHENAPVVVILFDDGGYGVLRNIQNAHFDGRTIGVDLRVRILLPSPRRSDSVHGE